MAKQQDEMDSTGLFDRYPAMSYPNYRLWFVGQMVSLFGTWMQSTAQGYLIFQLTNSPAYLGYVSFAAGLASWIFMLYAGVVADRVPRRSMLIVTQTTMLLLAFILAALAFLHLVQPWHIIILAFLLGVANAFDGPARQAFTLEMVERHDLANAIALNSTMFNSATFIGPAVGGITYSLVGPGWCFLLNGISFRFRRICVMSSHTPGSVVNSCCTPLMRTLVTAAPWMLLSSTRRRAWPQVVAKPRSNG